MSKETRTIEIYDPPMCCPSGLCGPALDPALLDVNEAILRLKSEKGVSVKRYLLTQSGRKFAENAQVMERLRIQGTEALPITAVNGDVVMEKRYPSYAELLSYIDSAKEN